MISFGLSLGSRAADAASSAGPATLLEATLAASQDALLVLDAATTIVRVNGAAARLLGCRESELLGRQLAELTPRAGAKELARQLRATRQHGSGRWSGVCLGLDGREQPVLATAEYLAAEGGQYVLVWHSQAESRRVGALLREGDERYRQTLLAQDRPHWELDCATDVMTYSYRWLAAFGHLNRPLGDSFITWAGLVHADDRAAVLEAIDQVRHGRTTEAELTHQMVHREGHAVHIRTRIVAMHDDHGQTRQLIGSHTSLDEVTKLMSHKQQHGQVLAAVAEAASALCAADHATADDAVHGALRLVAQALRASHAYTVWPSGAERAPRPTHEWPERAPHEPAAGLLALPDEELAWWLGQLRNGEPLHLPELAHLPPAADVARRELGLRGVSSLLLLPLRNGDQTTGLVGFETASERGDWAPGVVALLEILGQALGGLCVRLGGGPACRCQTLVGRLD